MKLLELVTNKLETCTIHQDNAEFMLIFIHTDKPYFSVRKTEILRGLNLDPLVHKHQKKAWY